MLQEAQARLKAASRAVCSLRRNGGVEIEIFVFPGSFFWNIAWKGRLEIDAVGAVGQPFQHQIHDRNLA